MFILCIHVAVDLPTFLNVLLAVVSVDWKFMHANIYGTPVDEIEVEAIFALSDDDVIW